MNLIPYDFNSKRLQVLVDENGEPWFIAMEVAEILGYSDAYEMTKRLDEDEKSNRQIAGLGTASGGRGVTTINESGLYSSIIGSNKPEAKPFKRWVTHDVLPSIRRTGSYSIGHQQAPALTSDACQIIESMSRTLNLAPSATLGMYQRLGAKVGHADLLPAYTVDSPVDDDTSHPTASLTELLKEHDVRASPVKVYKLMQEAGLVERLSRPSSKGNGTKEFWALTTKGLAFGKNVSNPNNQREVQPHFYRDQFEFLLECLHGETVQ
ncbi:TPA: Bro-N domain-containing protein [Pseudomonas aeruginosa]|uniref:BRO-N domain-containing protein n=1 Tax=Pseudomonas aeruginosa TaxID=287 RepID=UPI0015747095|nr:Bro-N domain-containing protein [Pseudomonas aeruginosa]NTT93912.1 Bro-N domain-containing protein [Pseudomonas aeruginosa]HCF3158028.1 Bro-N domain-containing protein [Pseudomonas aeruginosa]HDR2972462.1 Bro-N domain-containing protein [Pseudomonas aeruginosa]